MFLLKRTNTVVSLLLAAGQALSGCAGVHPSLAPDVTQPINRPARNFTSFSGALRCMDGLLAAANRPRVLISSSDIPDRTLAVRVGADDMLINAVSRMTRNSRAYVFLDQAIVKDGGALDIRVVRPRSPARPDYYIRGSISQLDRDAVNDSANSGLENDDAPLAGLTGVSFGRSRKLSVVSVDLHLVAYPSRQVVPGLSVANSMVVVATGRDASASGLISMTGLDLSLKINRVESNGQAVRNLIELGVIELLGRHAGVPYWTCLSRPDADPHRNSRVERDFVRSADARQIAEVQSALARLGVLSSAYRPGIPDAATRAAIAGFQAHEGLIASGNVDFDLIQRVRQRLAEKAARDAQAAAKAARPRAVEEDGEDDGYLPLFRVIDPSDL